jgi:hypothetical protein
MTGIVFTEHMVDNHAGIEEHHPRFFFLSISLV